VVSKKRPLPLPELKTAIISSAEHLTFRYAELLHLRQAVREAEMLARRVDHNPGPKVTQRKTSPAAD
jgi:hypothetical protein